MLWLYSVSRSQILIKIELIYALESLTFMTCLKKKLGKANCPECDQYENELAMNREVLVDSLGAWVVKMVSSPLAKLYSPKLEPAVVFFRHGIPMLYHGAIDEEEMLSKIQKCQDPTVKALNDETFEHLTQAATGATTGDWLVML